MVLDTINHVTIEGLGFKPVNYFNRTGNETYIRGVVVIKFDQTGDVRAIINGSLVPDINLQKLKLLLQRP